MGELCHQVEDLINLFGKRALMIPCKGKVPAIKWRELTVKVMSDPDHLTILSHYNIAIVNGKKSDGLCCIDVDEEYFTEVLLEKNPLLKNTTQTKGKRGKHFWFRLKGDCSRLTPLKYNGLDVGEFRSTGGITVISGKHPDGGFYRIENRVEPIEISFDDLWLPDKPYHLDITRDTEITEDNRSSFISESISKKPLNEEDVVKQSLPKSPRNNHKSVFELARLARTMEAQRGVKLSVQERDQLIQKWCEVNPYINPKRSLGHYHTEFLVSYRKVRFPKGETNILDLAVKSARTNPPPPEAAKFQDNQITLLISVLRELQLLHGNNPFFLSCRKAAELLGVKSYKTMNRRLIALEVDGIIKVVCRGGPNTNKANRYRYLGELGIKKA